ncbi:MAG: DNA repair protein RecN [Lachnospiraceae bacterium]|nr:DNA repair protein RecN [Lachnospiraceae bacterium]MBQ8231892.1 DNA repair protein RecN [Lachnospiraceae bacterium]
MLLSLHVKNLALIQETEVEFEEGLNILTGETGAGKSVLIGSINLALGGKFDKDMLRSGAESGLVELTFSGENELLRKKLQEMDIPVEDVISISRKLVPGKSVSKINGETVNVKQIKEIAEVLIDIHGQHEHQSLLHKKKHLEILDAYAGETATETLNLVAELYGEVKELKRRIEADSLDEESKNREMDLLQYEIQEIENAALKDGEDEELETLHLKLRNSKKITEALSESYLYTGSETGEGAAVGIGRAVRLLSGIAEYDKELEGLLSSISEIESLLSDYNRDVSVYLSGLEFDGEGFEKLEERLDQINFLKAKYGKTIPDILESLKKKQERVDALMDYDMYIKGLQAQLVNRDSKLKKACEKLSGIRREAAGVLQGELLDALKNLNFLSVDFRIMVQGEKEITSKGYDEVEFLISTNPGETPKSLAQVASGGELSRIMLGIKTVLAKKDEIDTLIFDEIDAGISGKTAWKVSGQLDKVAKAHQVICITHLPQIAAMADCHHVIEKGVEGENTVTHIRKLEAEESLEELARLLGSDEKSVAALDNAKAMREEALAVKMK